MKGQGKKVADDLQQIAVAMLQAGVKPGRVRALLKRHFGDELKDAALNARTFRRWREPYHKGEKQLGISVTPDPLKAAVNRDTIGFRMEVIKSLRSAKKSLGLELPDMVLETLYADDSDLFPRFDRLAGQRIIAKLTTGEEADRVAFLLARVAATDGQEAVEAGYRLWQKQRKECEAPIKAGKGESHARPHRQKVGKELDHRTEHGARRHHRQA
jgi:hypothetical protein